ncbi:L-threonylcarbamoyladenylate synthase [Kordiimonas pumila]|uniref:Threonylcarbamoyl-AMP synthase n=1 Tax=Kordiimonas pumila TaxID=2161677 RepID=A0ABV7D101_9PROT|nr:L-threonylcarbamoyladenylate synthase [Kordiimonas pumila]
MATTPLIIPANSEKAIALAVRTLEIGQLIAVPTETVYGLAADALNSSAVADIYTTKGRPSNNPLICHVSNISMAKEYVSVSPFAQKLMEVFWPGPLTLVLPKKETAEIPLSVTAGLKTLAVRCPSNAVTLSIIKHLGRPIAAPSANPSGKLSPTSAMDVAQTLGTRIALIIDGGTTDVGIESTIVSVLDNRITLLRPGSVTADDITAATGHAVFDRETIQITAPGQLASHYAPTANVRLNATNAYDHEIFIGFGDYSGTLNLSEKGSLAEAAHNLFSFLRKADETGARTIAVAPIPNEGIGIAINDRLKRAAAPRQG